MWKVPLDLIENRDGSPDVIIMGDSRAHAGLIPQLIGNNSYNLAAPGATPIEVYYMLEKYLENEQPEVLVLSFAPQHIQEQSSFMERTVKFGFFDRKTIGDIYTVSLNNKNDLRIQSKYFWIKYFGMKIKYLPLFSPEIRNSLFLRQDKNLRRYQLNSHFRGYNYQGTRSMEIPLGRQATKRVNFQPSPTIVHYFKRIIELCNQNGIRIVYVTMPFSQAKMASFDAEYLSRYNNQIMPLILANEDNSYVGGDTVYTNEYFVDKSHLNAKGAVRFSLSIADELKEMDILSG